MENNLVEVEESLLFKRFYDDDYIDEYKKINGIRSFFDGFKPIRTDDSLMVKKKLYRIYKRRR